MEFLRAGEALMRSSQPLLLPFLTPTAYRAPTRIGAMSRRCKPHLWQCTGQCRAISSSHIQLQQTGAAAARQNRQVEAQEEGNSEDDLFALLDRSLDGDKGVPTAPTGRTSRHASNTYQRGNNPISDRRVTGKSSTSMDQILGDLASGSSRQRPTPSSSSQSNTLMDVEGILGTASKAFAAPPPSAKATSSSNEPAPMKLNSTTGRVIQVEQDRGVDAATAFRRLGMRLAQNNVRKDAQRQRFHERPGLKRKRLKSERWRKRFKEAFQGTVARVVGLKRQGW